MALVTIGKNGQVYARKFDHEQARSLRAQGWTYPRMAEHFGVSQDAVRRVVDPKRRESADRRARKWMSRQRRLCLGGCGRLVWMHQKGRTGYCQRCLGALRAQSVRPNTLRCSRCRKWKADEKFPRQAKALSRRGRHGLCSDCQTIARREYRHAHPEQAAEENKRAREARRKIPVS